MQNFGERRFVFQEAPDPFKKAGEGAGKMFDEVGKLAEKVSGKRKDEMADVSDELATPGLGEAFDMVGELEGRMQNENITLKTEPPSYEEIDAHVGRIYRIADMAEEKGILGKEFELFGSKIKIERAEYTDGTPYDNDGDTIAQDYPVLITVTSPLVASRRYGKIQLGARLRLLEAVFYPPQHPDEIFPHAHVYEALTSMPDNYKDFVREMFPHELVVTGIVADTILPGIEKYLDSL